MSYSYLVTDQASNIAVVKDSSGREVYHIHGRDIVKARVMANELDLLGLSRYLAKLKVIPAYERIMLA